MEETIIIEFMIKIKTVKRILKIVGFVLLIILAGFGVGMCGGVPIPKAGRREDATDAAIELVETEDGESSLLQIDAEQKN